jgi:hypothetical protein
MPLVNTGRQMLDISLLVRYIQSTDIPKRCQPPRGFRMQEETAGIQETQHYLTAEQLAARHHSTVQAVYQRRWRGEGPPCIKVGKKLLFPRAELERWERKQSVLAP